MYLICESFIKEKGENAMVIAGIDIGAHSLRLVLPHEGLVFEEPALGAFNDKNEILAIGHKALELKGKNEKIKVLAPIHDGTVDLPVLEAILDELCYEFRLFRMFQKTILLVSYPTVLSDDMIDRLKDAFMALGANAIYFDQEIWISAIGSGLDLFLPVSSCVLNVGFSNCDIALFHQGSMEARWSSRLHNGEKAAELVSRWLERKENMEVSPSTIDLLVQKMGTVKLTRQPEAIKIRGIDLNSQALRELVINENDMAAILAPLARELGQWVSQFLESLDEQHRNDIKDRGIIASGGTMKIKGLAETLQTLADCPVYVTDEPDHTAAKGLEALMSTL